jgi:hypothetical protein
MLRQQGAGFDAHLEVVHAKVRGVGVRDIDGNKRNIRLFEDVRDARRHALLDLELDGQVHALGDELFGVLDSDVGVVLIVKDQQFDAGSSGGGRDALGNSHGEGHLGALGRKAETQSPGARDQPVKAILGLGHIAAMHEGFEDAIDASLGNLRLLIDIFKGNGGMILFEQFEHVERLGQNRNEVQPFDLGFGQRIVSWRAIPIAKLRALKDNAFQA